MINDQGSVFKESVFFLTSIYVKTKKSIRMDGSMARKQRKWYEGACYHIIGWGNETLGSGATKSRLLSIGTEVADYWRSIFDSTIKKSPEGNRTVS